MIFGTVWKIFGWPRQLTIAGWLIMGALGVDPGQPEIYELHFV
jgi:hypothetical protein